MTRGARTQADLERAVRSTQRRARDHEQRLRIIEPRLDAEDRQRGLDDVAAQILRFPHSPARTNSSPAFPTGGSDLAGTARCRARSFFSRIFGR